MRLGWRLVEERHPSVWVEEVVVGVGVPEAVLHHHLGGEDSRDIGGVDPRARRLVLQHHGVVVEGDGGRRFGGGGGSGMEDVPEDGPPLEEESAGSIYGDGIGGDLPLGDEGLGGGLKVALHQVVVDVYIEPTQLPYQIKARKKNPRN